MEDYEDGVAANAAAVWGVLVMRAGWFLMWKCSGEKGGLRAGARRGEDCVPRERMRKGGPLVVSFRRSGWFELLSMVKSSELWRLGA